MGGLAALPLSASGGEAGACVPVGEGCGEGQLRQHGSHDWWMAKVIQGNADAWDPMCPTLSRWLMSI